MVSIEEALSIVTNQVVHPTREAISLNDANGFYLAEDITSPFDLPGFDNSAMDGYAVCGSGKSFELVGEVAAGDVGDFSLEEGQAMRIFTGGKTPHNTSSVVIQEHASHDGNRVVTEHEVIEGRNIRRRAEQLAKGQLVFSSGQKINPAVIGLIGSLGFPRINVFKKPKVRIIATGNELVKPGEPLKSGQIYESNTGAISGALAAYGFDSDASQSIKDDLESIKDGIAEHLSQSDLLLLSGGISVGEYDFVKQALEYNGVKEQFYKVRQKPGKPLYFGRKEDKFVFGLPGNPASSLTCFYIYVLPLLDKLSGGEGKGLEQLELPLSENYHFKFDRPTFLKAFVKNGEVTILDGQGSSMIHSMAVGNALAFFDQARVIAKREPVKVILF